MKRILKIVCRLIIGFIFCSSGTVLAVNSNLGLSPWDVFHQGLSKMTGLSMGQVSIFVGLIVVIATIFLKLEIGLGTIANMILIGVLVIGFMLGGSVGIGTLITVFCLGACIQLVFKVLRFDMGKIKHKNIRECFVFFNKCING